MTLAPDAHLDPSALEAAVSEVDFTPTGVTVWLRGTMSQQDLPDVGVDEVAVWLVVEGSGQRFLLVASDDAGKAAIATASTAPPGSTELYGQATDADGTVTVRVEGINNDE